MSITEALPCCTNEPLYGPWLTRFHGNLYITFMGKEVSWRFESQEAGNGISCFLKGWCLKRKATGQRTN